MGKSFEQRDPRIAALNELDARIKSLERPGAGVQIISDNMSVSVPGMSNVADAIARLEATLKKPMRPVYDEKGKLIGGERVDSLGDEPTTRPVAMSYRGTWRPGDDYVESEFCTLSGSLWACRKTGTRSRPGTDHTWQLAVKKGSTR